MSFTTVELVRGTPRAQPRPTPDPLRLDDLRLETSGRSLLQRWLRGYLDWVWPNHPRTLREVLMQLGPGVVHLARLTGGAVLAFVLTRLLSSHLGPGPIDLTGALTALLVLQASTYSTLQMGAVRIGAVLTGITVSLAVSSWVGLTWWSLGLAIGSALVLAKLLGLGRQTLEAPISAMLILATSWHPIAVETRLFNTLIGAGVGISLAFLLPPGLPIRSAAHAVRRFAASQARLLEEVAGELDGSAPAPDADSSLLESGSTSSLGRWQQVMDQRDRAHQLTGDLRDSRRFNPRALGTADLDPVLSTALRELDASQAALHTLIPSLGQRSRVLGGVEAAGDSAPADELAGNGSGEERRAMAAVLRQLAEGLYAFGDLVQAEVQGEEAVTAEALERTSAELGEARGLLTELVLTGADSSGHLLLDGAVLAVIDRVLDLLDAGRRRAVQEQWRSDQAGKVLTRGTMLNRETLDELRRGRLRLRRTRVGG